MRQPLAQIKILSLLLYGVLVKLTDSEKQKIIEMIQAGKALPAVYKSKLFDSEDTEFIEATKDYKLVYKGK